MKVEEGKYRVKVVTDDGGRYVSGVTTLTEAKVEELKGYADASAFGLECADGETSLINTNKIVSVNLIPVD